MIHEHVSRKNKTIDYVVFLLFLLFSLSDRVILFAPSLPLPSSDVVRSGIRSYIPALLEKNQNTPECDEKTKLCSLPLKYIGAVLETQAI